MAYIYVFTEKGEKKVARFIKNCRAFRKELLATGKDTAETCYLPTIDSISEDINFWLLEESDEVYNNGWNVTDNYSLPIELIKGQDYIRAFKRERNLYKYTFNN